MGLIKNNFWKGKKVLITGHNGFKGSWLTVWLLLLKAEVYGFSLEPEEESLFNNLIKDGLTKKEDFGNLISKTGNIENYLELDSFISEVKPDIVFHLAAQPLVRESYLNPRKTWSTNVIGSLNLLESLKKIDKKCSVVMVTTDKVYKNNEWIYGYREIDELGGNDPYSASKACMEILIDSWIKSFCGGKTYQTTFLKICSARSGNVIGGGDWSKDRLIPDTIRAIIKKIPISIRNSNSQRPWLHVLEPLNGYMLLANKLYEDKEDFFNNLKPNCSYNFGPSTNSDKKVLSLVNRILKYFPNNEIIETKSSDFHEAKLLNLVSDKAFKDLNWRQVWDFERTIHNTARWYKDFLNGRSSFECCLNDIKNYNNYLKEIDHG